MLDYEKINQAVQTENVIKQLRHWCPAARSLAIKNFADVARLVTDKVITLSPNQAATVRRLGQTNKIVASASRRLALSPRG